MPQSRGIKTQTSDRLWVKRQKQNLTSKDVLEGTAGMRRLSRPVNMRLHQNGAKGQSKLPHTSLFQLLVNPMNIYEEQKIMLLYGLAGLGAVGWGTSPHIRCASLLLVPKMLGKEGRVFVLGYALAAIYEGPLSNLRYNLNEVIESLGCVVELQINNTRAAWRVSTAPLRAIFKDLMSNKESLKAETQDILKSFENLDVQVKGEVGYRSEDAVGSQETGHRAQPLRARLSTQKMYELKTKLRCSYVVSKAISSCHDWFNQKHKQCMQRIGVPLFNFLLCLPMKFKFFCDIAKVMEIWCRSRIPVEGNFGQTYDSLNRSIHGLDEEFSATIDIKEEKQAVLVGTSPNWEDVSTEVGDYVRRQEAQLEWSLGLLRALLSCTFLLVLRACFTYMDSYNEDIRFDNIYISTYFCQIDERRKKLGKETLLPLRKVEEKTVIFPLKPAIQATEMKNMGRELLETVPVLLLLLLLCVLDWALFSIFDTIRQHSFLQYSFQSSHKLEVKVGGDSMLARILRKTIGALNSSSETQMEMSNTLCLPQPVRLDTKAYFRAALPIGLLLCLCLLQAFGYRLRRVISAFFFPKREKKRILFLYNDLLRKRAAFTQVRTAAIIRRAQKRSAQRHHLVEILHGRCPLLRRWLGRRCVVCDAAETPKSYVCPTPGCETVYCPTCWADMRQRCPVCTPPELSSPAFGDSDEDATYAE
ncbi:E3 ubiquitin-protein ligase DCST1 isoform X1 [Talpa occidentalis]|uniref:E3 ubiquitin-protein ligase DCST1 isoform X1 n=1 Tax=Talpa occidentalis TaxID=50954 RepID=UPI00188F60DE|nr:E3 ubiquitin-protein ligase DCST1 isoform X1 [Talpa occidentalis]